MAKVIGVEKDLLGEQDSLYIIEFADLQSINKILSISSEIQRDANQDLNCMRSTVDWRF
jgi:hypothetical protein